MNKDKLAAITYIMTDMGVTLHDLFLYQSEIGKSGYDEMTRENEDETAWLDENVRGKEEQLRKRIEVKDGDGIPVTGQKEG